MDQSTQDNGVNPVFFQNEGCIFNADKPRATPGFSDLYTQGGP
jgi:hypothetical protein